MCVCVCVCKRKRRNFIRTSFNIYVISLMGYLIPNPRC